jgi:ubiquinone/menaquinone biosynthesis C-methylase UbiE
MVSGASLSRVEPSRYAEAMTYARAKGDSRATFDRLAATYENTVAGWHSRRMKDAALRHLGTSPRGMLLDVGCGPGLLLGALARRGPGLTLAGLDISPEMIRVAREHIGDGADLRVGDAEALPWEGQRFDYLVCVDSFHHYPHPEQALDEMHRVLKHAGRLVIADPTAPPIVRQLANALNPFLRHGDVRMYGRHEMTSMLRAHGFREIEWHRVGAWGFVVTALAR